MVQRSADAYVAACSSPNRNLDGVRTAVLFGLLLVIQFGAAALTPLNQTDLSDFWEGFTLFAVGTSLAAPPLLAVWAVFGPQRVVVRLPLTLWLAAAVNLCTLFGLKRNSGVDNEALILINAAWLLAFAVFQLPLWSLRAIRRWRLERPGQWAAPEGDAANSGGQSGLQSTSQFSIRSLLGWTLAAAFLFAALRALAPQGGLDGQEFLSLLLEAGLVSLLVALGGLPVVALAWIVLVDGRRLALRVVLSVLTLLGLAVACAFFVTANAAMPVYQVLLLEGGAIFNGLVAISVARVCGYQLCRRSKQYVEPAERHAGNCISQPRFALVLTALLMLAAGLIAIVPHHIEEWRRAGVRAQWIHAGIDLTFAEDGTISHMNYFQGPDRISDDTCRRIAAIDSLVGLDLSKSNLESRQLALFAPSAHLQSLNLSGTAVDDGGLKELGHYPELVQLDVSNTSITDAALAHLKTLSKLKTLNLSLTDISDEGLAALKELPAIESIDAQLTAVTSQGVEQLRDQRPKSKIEFGASDAILGRLPTARQAIARTSNSGVEIVGIGYETVKLKRLHARGKVGADGAGETVTDDGLISLTALQSELEELDLRDSAVTDKGVITLRTLKKLKRLDLRGAPVTEQGVAALARALPECEIVRK